MKHQYIGPIHQQINTIFRVFVFLLLLLSPTQKILAQEGGEDIKEEAQAPKVGRKAAQKYFEKNEEIFQESSNEVQKDRSVPRNSLLMLHIGRFLYSDAFEWKGKGKREDVAKATYGFTFFLSKSNNMDVNLRGDFIEFNIDNDHMRKLSLIMLLTFPQYQDLFPLYFGIGAGPGIFFQQLEGESNLSFDYQLIVGSRFLSRYNSAGFVIEFGLKNHLHILSDGQLNGTFLALGGAFTF